MRTELFYTIPMFNSLNANMIAVILGKIPTILGHRRVKEVVKETARGRRTLMNVVKWLLGNIWVSAFHVCRVAKRLQAIIDVGFCPFLSLHRIRFRRTRELRLFWPLRCPMIIRFWMVVILLGYHIIYLIENFNILIVHHYRILPTLRNIYKN